MAKIGYLPIYKVSYDLFTEILMLSKTLPRDFKFTLGRDLYDISMAIMTNIYKANSEICKKDFIKQLLSSTVEIGVLIRAAHDIKILSNEKYMSLMEKRDSIEKQAAGWLKSFSNAGISSLNEVESVHN